LWHMLGNQICVRLEGNGKYAAGVHGVVFGKGLKLDSSFANPLGREFPAGYTCFFARCYLYSGLGCGFPQRGMRW
jgi:hypothetical protein